MARKPWWPRHYHRRPAHGGSRRPLDPQSRSNAFTPNRGRPIPRWSERQAFKSGPRQEAAEIAQTVAYTLGFEQPNGDCHSGADRHGRTNPRINPGHDGYSNGNWDCNAHTDSNAGTYTNAHTDSNTRTYTNADGRNGNAAGRHFRRQR